MSDKSDPPNPFRRGDRTIIRPNPGGRLPSPPLTNQPPSSQPLPTPPPLGPGAPSPPGWPPGATPQRPPLQPPQTYAPAPTTPAPEEWISTPATPIDRQAPAPPPMRALPVAELVAPNANPIMRAAGPLLLLLGRLRVALV